MRRHGVEVVTMRGVGHFPMMEAAERFNSLLDEIVSERLSTSHSGSAAQA
jgi:pimeloyl-ACP methyl ester carboxylesterase